MNVETGSGGGGGEGNELASLVQRFRQASGSTPADRAARDQLLDELQEAVGLSGKMVTEADILRRAERVLGQ